MDGLIFVCNLGLQLLEEQKTGLVEWAKTQQVPWLPSVEAWEIREWRPSLLDLPADEKLPIAEDQFAKETATLEEDWPEHDLYFVLFVGPSPLDAVLWYQAFLLNQIEPGVAIDRHNPPYNMEIF